MEEIYDIERGRLWRFIFLHNTKSSSFGGTQKLYCMRVLEDLHEFFKFNLCSYNILKIKNILIINITALLKNVKDFTIFPCIFNSPISSLPLPSKLPNKT